MSGSLFGKDDGIPKSIGVREGGAGGGGGGGGGANF
jgi:hypothetical protein